MEKSVQPRSGLGQRELIEKNTNRVCVLFLFLLGLMLNATLFAEPQSEYESVYRWQDEFGRWHFTNDIQQPPADAIGGDRMKATTVLESQWKNRDPVDLTTALKEQLKPNSPLEVAMLAVVSIQTSMARGVGFFVNNEGYIVTLATVVRPERHPPEALQVLNSLVDAQQQAKAAWDLEKNALSGIQHRVSALKKRRDEAVGREKRDITEILSAEQRVLLAQIATARQAKHHYHEKRTQFERANTQLSIDINRSKLKQTFPVILADGRRHMTDLITIDQKSGLAILRLHGYITPKLTINMNASLTHGMSLYLIRPPQDDNMTGYGTAKTTRHASVLPVTVIQKTKGHVRLDQALAAADGGAPLLTSSGQLAVIALRPASEIDGEGYHEDDNDLHFDGLAAKVVLKSFPYLL